MDTRWCERKGKREGTVQTTGVFRQSNIEQITLHGLVSAHKNTTHTHTFRVPEITVSLYYVR